MHSLKLQTYMKWKIQSHSSSFSNIDIIEVLIPLESTVKVSDTNHVSDTLLK